MLHYSHLHTVSGWPNGPHEPFEPSGGRRHTPSACARRQAGEGARLRAPDVRNYYYSLILAAAASLTHFYNVELVYIYSLTHSSYTHTHTHTRAHTHTKKIFSHGSAVVEFRNFFGIFTEKTNTHTHTRTHTHARTRTHAYIHTHTCTHAHTRIHTHTRRRFLLFCFVSLHWTSWIVVAKHFTMRRIATTRTHVHTRTRTHTHKHSEWSLQYQKYRAQFL